VTQGDTATWVGAAATVAAVVVALFGPGVRSWWSRPRLGLSVDEDNIGGEEFFFSGGDEDSQRVQPVSLLVTNRGRREATDVEAVLTVRDTIGPIAPEADDETEIPAFEIRVVGRGALRFELSRNDRPTITVPAGSARTLHFVLLGRADAVRQVISERGDALPGEGDAVPIPVGTFALLPVDHPDRMTWILDDQPLGVTVTLTSTTARARTWTARIKAWHWHGIVDEPGDFSGIKFEWLERPRRMRGSELPPSRLRVWIIGHTPWALIRAVRYRREFERAMADVAKTD
jgi:hypothetical protein